MSMPPNNPFEPRKESYTNQPPQTKPTNVWLWVFATIGVLFVCGSLVCCGGGYFLFNKATEVIADAAAQKLRTSPVVKEHLGEIESTEINLSDTMEAQKGQRGEDRMIVLDVKGSKANGRVEVKLGRNEEDFKGIELVLEDGTRHEIRIESMMEKDDAADEPATELKVDSEEPSSETPDASDPSDKPQSDPLSEPFDDLDKTLKTEPATTESS